MADLKKIVQIIFSGVDEISAPVNTITNKLDGFSANVEAIAQPLGEAADGILKFDAAITALAAGGLLYAFNESKKFESAIIELKKVLGDGQGVDQAIDEATELSDIYGQSAQKILLSIADFKQAGFDLADSLTLTKDSLDLVIAGNIESAQSTDLIIAALRGFGKEADQARHFVDILNEVSNNYATDVAQLATGMAGISPIASQMGFSMEETAGMITPVIEIFRSGDEAARALKTGLVKLVDDAKPVQDALASIGVAQFDVNGQLRSGKDIFIDVATAFQTLDDKQKLFITSQLVGIDQSARMVKVFDNLSLSTDIATAAMGSAGSAAREVAERLKSAEVAVDRFQVGFENLARTIGDQFSLAVVEAIKGGTDIEKALRDIVDSGTFQPVFDVINDFSSNLGALLSKVAENLPEAFEQVDFDGLLRALKEVGNSIGLVFEGVDLRTPEGLAKAIQSVIKTLESLAYVTAGMINQFRPFIQNIAGLISSFNDLDVQSKKSAGEILGLAKAVADAGLEIAAAIILIGGYADDLAPVFKVAINTIVSLFDAVKLVFNGLKLAFIDVVDGLLAASELLTKLPGFKALADDVEANRLTLAKWRESASQDMREAGDSFLKHATGIQTNFADLGKSAQDSAKEINDYAGEFDGIPEEKKTDVAAQVDNASIDQAKADLDNKIPDRKDTDVFVKSDAGSVQSAANDINSALPDEKTTVAKLENQTKTELARIKADADIVQTAMEWEAKLDIAEVEAKSKEVVAQIEADAAIIQEAFKYKAEVDTAQIEADAKVAAAAFDSVAESVSATSDAAASMFDSLLSNIEKLGFVDKWQAWEVVQRQLDMEQQALDLQARLTEAQIEYMRRKSDALANGDGLIKISSDGLEPALEMIMWEIIQKVQLRVTEESAEFLLGLGVS